jgi:hypothetical protein
MEDPLATAPPPRRPHRERRHRRKASDAAAAALAAQAASSYGDVFGGPPRFAPPPAAGAGTAPADYAEVFGGVAASCSIPYLDLPPAVASGVGAGGYGEIFGRFDFGEFAVPYEDMLSGAESLVEEIASPSGSSRYELCSRFRISFFFFFFPAIVPLLPEAHCSGQEFCSAFRRGLIFLAILEIMGLMGLGSAL